MKGFEIFGVGFALLFVPIAAWLGGRASGRRDFGVVAVIVAALVSTAVAYALALVASSGLETAFAVAKPSFQAVLARRVGDIAVFPEFVAFLGAFGIFIGMVGWSSVPAANGVAVAR